MKKVCGEVDSFVGACNSGLLYMATGYGRQCPAADVERTKHFARFRLEAERPQWNPKHLTTGGFGYRQEPTQIQATGSSRSRLPLCSPQTAVDIASRQSSVTRQPEPKAPQLLRPRVLLTSAASGTSAIQPILLSIHLLNSALLYKMTAS